MANRCEICAKKKNIAWTRIKLRGKYNPTSKHAQKPNLQWTQLFEPYAAKFGVSAGTRVKACAKCMKALSKT
ncbi:MAG: hypothetical protein Q8P39_00945 [Candidatus Yanofskybacteria bacterium]|nr:hypothetical protein [Candidatus Yanofskybacteria bacterium]